MYPPTANAAADARPARTTPRITSRRPNVATSSPSQMPAPERTCVESVTAGRSNMRFATIAPTHAPIVCAITYTLPSRVLMPPSSRSASVTTGLKCAPEIGPSARISATSPAPVAVEFWSSCSPTLFGERRCAAMPEPTTIATSSAVPTASALERRRRSRSTRRSAAPSGGLGRRRATERVRNLGASQRVARHLDVGEDRVDLPRLGVGAVDPHLVLQREAALDLVLGRGGETLGAEALLGAGDRLRVGDLDTEVVQRAGLADCPRSARASAAARRRRSSRSRAGAWPARWRTACCRTRPRRRDSRR